ncbi:EexN family lipoprotein [Bradyrhizobium sp. USDA 4520]
MRGLSLLCGLALLATTACAEEPRSAEYYAAHETEAKAVLADCAADKVRGQECDNAQKGAMIAAANRVFDYKPSTQQNKLK